MKKKPQYQPDWHERRIEEQRAKDLALRYGDRPLKMAPAKETLPEPAKKSSGVGLANEPRPGLGSRASGGDPAKKPAGGKAAKGKEKTKGKPRATKRGYEEPPPAPREQAPDSLAHEQERQTGMSGQSSGM